MEPTILGGSGPEVLPIIDKWCRGLGQQEIQIAPLYIL